MLSTKNNHLNNQNKACNYIICFDKKHMNTGFQIQIKVRFLYECSDHLSHSKNFTSLFPLIFLSKHISLYALGRIRWILDIIWPLNQHFKLKNQRNWLNQVWMWKFWNVINCILLHWRKKLTLGALTNFATIAITIMQVKTYIVAPLEGKSYTTFSTIGVMT